MSDIEKKSPFRSVTLWVNLIGGAAVAVLTQLGQYLDASWVGIALSAANFALRFKTDRPII